MATRVVPGLVRTVITDVAFIVLRTVGPGGRRIAMLIPDGETLVPLDELHDLEMLAGHFMSPAIRSAIPNTQLEAHIYALNLGMIHVELMSGSDIELQVKIVPGRPAFAALQTFLLAHGCWPI